MSHFTNWVDNLLDCSSDFCHRFLVYHMFCFWKHYYLLCSDFVIVSDFYEFPWSQIVILPINDSNESVGRAEFSEGEKIT